jgi:hypothetical protein
VGNELNESKESIAERPVIEAHVTVETDTTLLLFVADPNTGGLRLRESQALAGASAPFVVYTDGEVAYVSIPVDNGGRFTVTVSATLSEPTPPPTGRPPVIGPERACAREDGGPRR